MDMMAAGLDGFVHDCFDALENVAEPLVVARTLGSIEEASEVMSPGLVLVLPTDPGAPWSRLQVLAGVDGTVRALVIDVDPEKPSSVADLERAFGQAEAIPGLRGSDAWAWRPEQLGVPATLFAESEDQAGKILSLTIRPEPNEAYPGPT